MAGRPDISLLTETTLLFDRKVLFGCAFRHQRKCSFQSLGVLLSTGLSGPLVINSKGDRVSDIAILDLNPETGDPEVSSSLFLLCWIILL